MAQLPGVFTTAVGSVASAEKCDHCGGHARLANGICVRCMLEGSRSGGELTEEELARELAGVDVQDDEWQLGQYAILSELGRGGMGVIYRARQEHSGRIVALKRVLVARAGDRDWVERFRREVKAAASLDHPNVLPIYEIGEDTKGLPYFSMKLAAGGSLRTAAPHLADKPRECARLIAKVARAVEHAHSRGVLHRDLQPGNILLDDAGEPLVSDFGLARLLNEASDLTQTLTTFGTPGYIAPEQAEGSPGELKPSADVYSLGAILFYLLARRPPFVGGSALSVIKQAGVSDAPMLRSIVATTDRDLETIVARCLERDPNARYQTAGELADDLERWLDARRIVARPVSLTGRLRRWSWRNPALAATATASAILAGAFVWSLARRPAPERPVAEQSIAILPIENVTPNEGNRFVAAAIEEDLVTALGKVAGLKVISRSSVRDYKPDKPRNLPEIAKALGVRHLVEGSVRSTGDKLHVNARLTDAQTGRQLWASEYERDLQGLSSLEGEIANSVVDHLSLRVSAAQRATMNKQPTTDFAAYDLYLEATELIYSSMATGNPAAALKKAALLLEEAIQRDPAFVRAYCELARANENLYWNDLDRTPERLTRAKHALDEAVRRGPELGETHHAQARYNYTALRDYDAAARELEIAHRLLPNDSGVLVWQGLVDRRLNRWPEALRKGQQAHELNPRDGETIRALADTLLEMRQYSAAEQLLKGALVTIPQHAPVFFAKLAECYLGRGDPKTVRALSARLPSHPGTGGFEAYYHFLTAIYLRDFDDAKTAIAGTANIPDHIRGPFCPPAWFEGLLARAQHRDDEARAAFTQAQEWTRVAWGEEPTDPMQVSLLARIEAGLGDKEASLKHARAAVGARPLERDSFDGPTLATSLTLVYAWLGERDLALEELTKIAPLPGGPSYGDLQLNPRWDDLRGDPRFETIIASIRPSQ